MDAKLPTFILALLLTAVPQSKAICTPQAEGTRIPFPFQGGAWRVHVSPNGKWVAAINCRGFMPGGVPIIGGGITADLKSGKVLYSFPFDAKAAVPGKGDLTDIAFSRDSKYLVTVEHDLKSFTLWNAATGKKIRSVIAYEEWIEACRFSPDGKHLATLGCGKRTPSAADGEKAQTKMELVKIWEVETWDLKKVYDHTTTGMGLAYNHDGTLIAYSSGGEVVVWNLKDDTKTVLKGKPVVSASALCFSPKSNLLANASSMQLELWDVDTGMLIRTWPSREFKVDFSPDGNLIAIPRPDGSEVLKVQGDKFDKVPRDVSTGMGAFTVDGKSVVWCGWDYLVVRPLKK